MYILYNIIYHVFYITPLHHHLMEKSTIITSNFSELHLTNSFFIHVYPSTHFHLTTPLKILSVKTINLFLFLYERKLPALILLSLIWLNTVFPNSWNPLLQWYIITTPLPLHPPIYSTLLYSPECPLLKYVCSFILYIFSWTSPKYCGFSYHLHADDFQMFISNPKLALKFLLDMSTQVSPKIKQIQKWIHPL